MDKNLQEAWEIANNPRYKYAVGQLAAALLIATKALDEVGGKQTIVARLSNSGSTANKALEDIRALLGDRVTCLEDLAADFYHLQQAAEVKAFKPQSKGMQP